MIGNDDDMLIQRYLDDDMTESEKLDFEIRLRQTKGLQERMEEYRLITHGIRHFGAQEAWKKIQALEAEAEALDFNHESKPIVTKWLYRGIAASLLLFMIGFSFYWQQDERRYARLFDQYFNPYQVLGGANRGESQGPFALPRAFETYYEKDYAQAIILFKEASVQEDRAYIWLYLGNAYLGNDQPQEAVEALKHVFTYANTDERTRIRTHWDLGLAHLKLNHTEEALYHFQAIQDTEDYGQKAKTILKSIH